MRVKVYPTKKGSRCSPNVTKIITYEKTTIYKKAYMKSAIIDVKAMRVRHHMSRQMKMAAIAGTHRNNSHQWFRAMSACEVAMKM